jgi:hypothetical protein
MKIKVITVATRETDQLKALIRSATRCDMDLTVLGLNEGWGGFGTKVILTRNYLKTLQGYTHFIFVDAYDTLFLKHIDTVPDFLFFSSEKNCWPDIDAPYPPSDKIWKYLNSGVYSAPINEFLEITDKYPIVARTDDQRYFTTIYLDGYIQLDTNCDLYQSYAFSSPDDFTLGDKFINNKTKTEPSIIHFNGKCLEPKIYNMVEYSTLEEVKKSWHDNSQYAKELNETFIKKVNDTQLLNEHRTFVENNIFGFGERAFPWLWNLIVKEVPQEFTFLEIGVFKGQTLSLIELLAKYYNKKATRYGITPLSSEGGVWESNYKADIEYIHDKFNLNKDYNLLVGLSEDTKIIQQASTLSLDILYIDGGHEERHITNDLVNYQHLVKVGGFLVIDDCCNSFKMPFGYFQGIDSVTKVVDKMLPPFTPSSEWEFVFSVVHNRVYRRIK